MLGLNLSDIVLGIEEGVFKEGDIFEVVTDLGFYEYAGYVGNGTLSWLAGYKYTSRVSIKNYKGYDWRLMGSSEVPNVVFPPKRRVFKGLDLNRLTIGTKFRAYREGEEFLGQIVKRYETVYIKTVVYSGTDNEPEDKYSRLEEFNDGSWNVRVETGGIIED